MKKIELRVSINCNKCKTDVMKAVNKLEGINSVTVDGGKGTLTVVGDVDPVLVTRRVRKIGKVADIISVGSPKPPEPKPAVGNPAVEKPAVGKPAEENCWKPLPPCCNDCQLVGVGFGLYDDPRFCSIL